MSKHTRDSDKLLRTVHLLIQSGKVQIGDVLNANAATGGPGYCKYLIETLIAAGRLTIDDVVNAS